MESHADTVLQHLTCSGGPLTVKDQLRNMKTKKKKKKASCHGSFCSSVSDRSVMAWT